jgi:hypothetical protein
MKRSEVGTNSSTEAACEAKLVARAMIQMLWRSGEREFVASQINADKKLRLSH